MPASPALATPRVGAWAPLSRGGGRLPGLPGRRRGVRGRKAADGPPRCPFCRADTISVQIVLDSQPQLGLELPSPSDAMVKLLFSLRESGQMPLVSPAWCQSCLLPAPNPVR
ncbi:uncharacterized protein PHA67_003172 [Liasis olivaceus]